MSGLSFVAVVNQRIRGCVCRHFTVGFKRWRKICALHVAPQCFDSQVTLEEVNRPINIIIRAVYCLVSERGSRPELFVRGLFVARAPVNIEDSGTVYETCPVYALCVTIKCLNYYSFNLIDINLSLSMAFSNMDFWLKHIALRFYWRSRGTFGHLMF